MDLSVLQLLGGSSVKKNPFPKDTVSPESLKFIIGGFYSTIYCVKLKIPSEKEVAQRYTLFTLFNTVYTIQTVLYCLNSDMPAYI